VLFIQHFFCYDINKIGRDSMQISLTRLFFTFLKIGAFTFGGGYAMIPIIERELVYRYKYIKTEDFYDTLIICQSLPGVIAINFSVFIGLKLRGVRGAVVAAVGVALPSFIIIMTIAAFFFQYIENPIVEAFFKGVRVSVVGLIFLAGFKLLKQNRSYFGVFVAALTFALIVTFEVHPFIIIVSMGLFGLLITKTKEVMNHDPS